jgi:hypothetical protein
MEVLRFEINGEDISEKGIQRARYLLHPLRRNVRGRCERFLTSGMEF